MQVLLLQSFVCSIQNNNGVDHLNGLGPRAIDMQGSLYEWGVACQPESAP